MKTDDEYPNFVKNLCKFVNTQFSKTKLGAPRHLKANNVDQLLEEEYEKLLKEIDNLTGDKSCYLNFKNARYDVTSSEELFEKLNKHSSEVLQNYIKRNGDDAKNIKFSGKEELINYVTEIIVSRPKCNNKLCSCKPAGVSKAENTDNAPESLPKEETIDKSSEASPQTIPKGNQTKEKKKPALKNIENQTDMKTVGIDCGCNTCPSVHSKANIKEKDTSDSTKANKDVTIKEDVFTNCANKVVSEVPSKTRLCLPKDFEAIENLQNPPRFSVCTSTKHECSCEVYDVKEALRRGLVLPCSEICIQNKANKKGKKNKSKSKKNTTTDPSDNETSVSSSEAEKKKKKEKKKSKKKSEQDIFEDSSSVGSTPRKKPKKKKRGGGCFPRKKKGTCDEDCQLANMCQKSMQTLPISTQDQNNQVYPEGHNGRKAAQTSTSSEASAQASIQALKEDKSNNKPEQDAKETGSSKTRFSKNHEAGDAKNVMYCSRCGKKKQDCSSGCRNTIVIPISGSNKNLSAGEAESLRMLIKMQNKDMNSQLDNIKHELSYQKDEIKRLNDVYRKVLNNLRDVDKSNSTTFSRSSRRKKKSSPDNYREDYYRSHGDPHRGKGRSCGCRNNECKTFQRHDSSWCISRNKRRDEQSSNSNSEYRDNRTYGPLNSTIGSNIFEVYKADIHHHNQRRPRTPRREIFTEKRQKDLLNESQKNHYSSDDINLAQSSSPNTSSIFDRIEEVPIPIREVPVPIQEVPIIKLSSEKPKRRERVEFDLGNISKQSKPLGFNGSRVMIWLKRSWISIRNKKDEGSKEGPEKNHGIVRKCQNKIKSSVAGVLKSLKKIHPA